MITKQEYLEDFRNAENNQSQHLFLQRWCREHDKPFEELMVILRINQTFVDKLVEYLDRLYGVTRVIDMKTNETIRVI